MQLQIEKEIVGGTLNLTLSGAFDMEAVPEFRKAVETDQDNWETVVIDLTDVDFMDSSGLQELVRLHDRTRQVRLKMVLARPSVAVRRLFELTGLDTRFDVRD
jgi:anti-sigma B factor antagonist